MKKLLFAFIAMLTLIAFSSCTKGDDDNGGSTDEPNYVDATSETTWHYFTVTNNKSTLVGTGEDTDDATWFAKTDWDFAIQRYMVRTNSGSSSSKNGKGGLYTFAKDMKFEDITTTPSGVTYVLDENTTGGMPAKFISRQSVARVLISTGMPPTLSPSPVYAIKSADGTKVYALDLLSYKDADNNSGHVKFNIKEITDGGSSKKDANYVDATSSATWHYFKGGDGAATLVGTGEDTDDATWFAKTDWDFAIQKNKIRTNSGTSTTTSAKGGLFAFTRDLELETYMNYIEITQIPANITYVVDAESDGISKQPTASVAARVGTGMPPVYGPSATYAIKSADGTKVYKLQFLTYVGYLEAAPTEKKFGVVNFKIAEIN